MKQILLDNALESWAMAIHYCDQIMLGKATLTNRKYFITSLQNAIELFVKQYMLNTNDYRVAEVKRYESDGEPLKSYLMSSDLNEYFRNKSKTPNEMKRFFTIEFSKIKELQGKLFKEYYDQNPGRQAGKVSEALSILQKLRNDETHFYISDMEFLTDAEFKELYNLMVTFYEILNHYHLFRHFGTVHGKESRFAFDRLEISSFSYKKQVKSSPFVKELKNNIEGLEFPWGHGDESYAIAMSILDCCDAYKEDDFDELWAYVEMLIKYNLLTIKDVLYEDIVDGEKVGECHCEYELIL